MTRRAVIVGHASDADGVAAALGRGSHPLEVVRVVVPGEGAGEGHLPALARASDLVVEAAPDEPLSGKAAALAMVLGCLPASVPIAVVTRRHTLADLLPAPRHGSRVVGLRLLPGTHVAEVAMAAAFDDAIVDAVLDLLEGAGLVSLPCGDGPGRIVDRLVAAAAMDVRHLMGVGLLTPADAAAATARAGLSLTAIAPDDLPPVAASIDAGLGGAPRFTIGTPQASPAAGAGLAPLDTAVAATRLELVVIAEAYRLVGEAVAGAQEIERAMTQGAGWAVGPFTMAGRLGLRAVVTGLAALGRAADADAVTADRFAIPPLLWQMATV